MTQRITSADVIITSPGRNYVTLKIVTSDGVVGWGDATVNGRELAVASYLADHVVPLLIGREADRIEDTWQFLYRSAYWRRGPVTMAAIGAVDLALWDIKGKSLGVPVYQLLGGAVRDRILTYTHTTGRDIAELKESVAEKLEAGFRAIRVQSGVPGLNRVYGVNDRGGAYEPAQRSAVAPEEDWDSDLYLKTAPAMLEEIRAHVGPDIKLLHDVHHRLTPIQAARLGKAIEHVGLFWLEDVTPGENQEILHLVRQHTTVPLAIGEVFNTIWDVKDFILTQSIDFIRTCVMHAGGLSHVRKIFDLGDLYGIQGAPHGPSDVSPITMAASMQLGLAQRNFGIQEYMGYPDLAKDVFTTSYTFADGYFTLGDAPGLGVDFDEEAAKKYPYEAAYLPYARRLDGTVADW
ncbi:MAG: D-galactonate dehydratase family protein [Propioniciclava sp.]|uniref:D-mannonate dehydratase ManD n=1 Tax=Propioniciclava sp. TaxID=2038686 RepID=UPI0039E724F3